MKILLVNDYATLRQGMRALLQKGMDIKLLEEAANGREAAEVVRKTMPDVILMDIGMPAVNGLDVARPIVAENPRPKMLGLFMNSDSQYVLALFDAEAVGPLLKEAPSRERTLAVWTVLQNHSHMSSAVAVNAIARTRGSTTAITSREREVLQLVAEGRTSKGIGLTLHIAATTVETHRREIMRKLDIHTVAGLTKYAVREGLTILQR